MFYRILLVCCNCRKKWDQKKFLGILYCQIYFNYADIAFKCSLANLFTIFNNTGFFLELKFLSFNIEKILFFKKCNLTIKEQSSKTIV